VTTDVRKTYEALVKRALGGGTGGRRNKYGAIRTLYKDVLYDSRAEADFAAYLDRLVLAKIIRSHIRQVPYVLAKGAVYRADFCVSALNGTVIAIDVKGADTAVSRLKRKLVKSIHGVDVVIVKAQSDGRYSWMPPKPEVKA
jgi:hypothetical protein